jgi:hypothetical protein
VISRARLKTPFCRCLETSPNAGYAGSGNAIITDVPAGYKKARSRHSAVFLQVSQSSPSGYYPRISSSAITEFSGSFVFHLNTRTYETPCRFFRCLKSAQNQDNPEPVLALRPSPNLGSYPTKRACETPSLFFACVSQAQIQDSCKISL